MSNRGVLWSKALSTLVGAAIVAAIAVVAALGALVSVAHTNVINVRKPPLLLLAVWLLAMAVGMFVAKPAAAASGQISGNPTCKSLLNNERAYEIKVGAGEIKDGAKYGPITFKNVNSAKTLMGFDSTVRVRGVFVKGGPEGGYFYDYRLPNPPGGSLGDTNMGTKGYGNDRYQISHVSFCWDGELVAQPDVYDVDEDSTLEVGTARGVLGNDADLGRDQITAELVSSPSNGTLTLRADGSFTYTPNKDFNGTDTFTYTVSDGKGGTATTTVTITVKAVNDAPVAKDLTGESDQLTTPEDTPKDITLAASDVDSNNLTFSIVNGPPNGTLSGSGANLTYTPNKDFNGSDSFTFKVCDDSTPEPLCDEGRIDLNVTPVNDAPVANDDSYSTEEDTTLSVPAPGVLENDTDADGDELTVRLVNGPSHGVLDLRSAGSFTFTPSADFDGEDSFTYRVCDSSDACSEPVSVTITVTAVNDTPRANNDGSTGSPVATMNEDDPNGAEIDVLANDTGLGDRPITVTATDGTAKVNPDNTVTYTPGPNESGDDTLTYTVGDIDGDTSKATVFVHISSVNDPPQAVDDRQPTGEDEPVTVNVLANDNDSEGELDSSSVRVLTPPQHGQTTVNGDGSITYNPDANFNGTDTFTYEVCDAQGECSTATVEIRVGAANDAPTASDDLATTDEDRPVRITVLANDEDPEGKEELDSSGVEITIEPTSGTAAVNPDGSITYTPDADFNGADAFTYQVCDTGAPRQCDTAQVDVTVNPVNDAPLVRDDRGSTSEAEGVSNSYISQYASSAEITPTRLYQFDTVQRPYTLNKVGADVTGPLNALGYRSTDHSLYGYRLTSSPGILKVNPNTGAARYLGNPLGLPTSVTFAAGDVSPSGAAYYLYAPKSGVLWKVNLTTFRASSVELSSAIAVFDLAVSPTDGNLYGVDRNGRLLQVNPQTGRVTARNVAGLEAGGYGAAWFTAKGDLIVYENGAARAHGTMVWIARPDAAPSVVSSQAGPSTRNNDGASYVGPTDPAGLSVVVDVLDNDSDPDGALNRNTLRIFEPPDSGTVRINADKTITYTSGGSYSGTDSFRYEVCDNGVPRQCDTATVDIISAPITSSSNRAASRKK